MQISSAGRLVQFKNLLQTDLFPVLESVVGPLSKQSPAPGRDRELTAAGALGECAPGSYRPPPRDRLCLATAFFAKAVYNLSSTRHRIERLRSYRQLRRLCGWERATQVPVEATFSRAFSEFAASGLPAQIQAALVKQYQPGRTIEYLARDSTAIEARQRLPEDQPKAAASNETACSSSLQDEERLGQLRRTPKRARTNAPRPVNAVCGYNANST